MRTSLPFAIYPDWPVPDNIVAFSSLRKGAGVSQFPYEQFNLAAHVGDDPDIVKSNRMILNQSCEGLDHITWLNQVHGTRVVTAGEENNPVADGCISSAPGVGCAVMTADCLPVILCDQYGQQIAAVHAGWRGLAAGVVEEAIAQFAADAADILVWLGPAIGPENFEVGEDVRQSFLDAASTTEKRKISSAFVKHGSKKNHFFSDLYQIARIRLNAMSVTKVYGGGLCTYADPDRFYSYRRDGVTGRMVTMIYKKSIC
ncbi:MAG: peptidoglycan editing factor PgeF [Oceanicoccus sp.]